MTNNITESANLSFCVIQILREINLVNFEPQNCHLVQELWFW